MEERKTHRYLEYTVLTVFFWIGLWGATNLLVEHLFKSWFAKLGIYIIFVISSFSMLHLREHIPNL